MNEIRFIDLLNVEQGWNDDTNSPMEYLDTLERLEVSAVVQPSSERQFIHIDRMPNGKWKLTSNVHGLDVSQLSRLNIVRENDL